MLRASGVEFFFSLYSFFEAHFSVDGSICHRRDLGLRLR